MDAGLSARRLAEAAKNGQARPRAKISGRRAKEPKSRRAQQDVHFCPHLRGGGRGKEGSWREREGGKGGEKDFMEPSRTRPHLDAAST